MDSVGVVILTKNNFKVFKKCLDSFIEKNTYENIKFYIGDTGSNIKDINRIKKYLNKFPYPIELIKFNYYNFAKNHNWIINNRLKEELVLFCNDDIELINDSLSIMHENWEDNLCTVGCKLLYPNNTIQHGGHIHVINKEHNMYNVTHKYLNDKNTKLSNEYNVGNTFAFCLVKRDTYLELDGLNEDYKKCFEDVDFCIKGTNNNYKHKFIGSAECYHYESMSRKKSTSLFVRSDVERIRNELKSLYKDY